MSQPHSSTHTSPDPTTSKTLPDTQPDPSQPQSQPDDADTEAMDDTTTLDLNSSASGTATAATSTMPDPRNESPDQHPPEPEESLHQAEARIAQKKELTLREFLGKMEDYAPIIPDALTSHYLTLAGLPPPPATPLPLARLLALATQKFIADIAADSYQYARIRSGHTTSNTAAALAAAAGTSAAGPGVPAGAAASAASAAAGGKQANIGTQRAGYGGGGGAPGGAGGGQSGQGRTVLTMEDLGMAVGEYGVNVKRGEFYR